MARKMSKIATKAYDMEKGSITFKWADGTEEIIIVSELPEEIRTQAMFHGLIQKGGDSYASAENLTDAKERFHAVLAALKDGEWNRRREGGVATGGVWIHAVARVTGQDVEDVRVMWEGLDVAQQKAVKTDPRVKKAKAEIDLERAEGASGNATDLEGLFNLG